MFKKFNEKENVSGVIQAKGTVIKQIRTKLIEDYPYIEDYIDEDFIYQQMKKTNNKCSYCLKDLELFNGYMG
jgi:hypothetical protein